MRLPGRVRQSQTNCGCNSGHEDFPGVHDGKITIGKDRNAEKSAVIIAIKNGAYKYAETIEPKREGVRQVLPPADLTLQQLVDEHILGSGQRCFLVNREDTTVGLMTLHRIKEVPRDQWTTTSAAQVMLPLEQLKRISPDKKLWTALQQMDRDGVNQLPVMTNSRVVGMLNREDVITFLRTLQELGT